MFNGILPSGTRIIAEVKLWSPFRERLSENSFERQLELAIKVGWMISIHTHPIWTKESSISYNYLRRAREKTSKPVLAKSFNGTDEEISGSIAAGATNALVVGRYPGVFADRCFIEPLTLGELYRIPETNWVVWNSRDLSSLKDLPGVPPFLIDRWKRMEAHPNQKRGSFQEARKIFQGRLCQASNLRTKDDVLPGADAVLVGTHLEPFAASLGIYL